MKTIPLLAFIAFSAILPSLQAVDAKSAKPYPLETCVISGEKLGEMGKPVVFVYEGQEIKLCCGACKKSFEKDPASAMKKIGSAVDSKSGM
jgi:hypothetical protein